MPDIAPYTVAASGSLGILRTPDGATQTFATLDAAIADAVRLITLNRGVRHQQMRRHNERNRDDRPQSQ